MINNLVRQVARFKGLIEAEKAVEGALKDGAYMTMLVERHEWHEYRLEAALRESGVDNASVGEVVNETG